MKSIQQLSEELNVKEYLLREFAKTNFYKRTNKHGPWIFNKEEVQMITSHFKR